LGSLGAGDLTRPSGSLDARDDWTQVGPGRMDLGDIRIH
jgi:hypothetical protein